MLAGAEQLNIHGQQVPVRAAVEAIHGLSAHADADEIVSWLRVMPSPPERAFVIHGEPKAAEALAARLSSDLGWPATIPVYGQSVEPPPRQRA